MSKYILFAGHHYYPRGGMFDFHTIDTLEACMEYFAKEKQRIAGHSYCDNWGHIVDPKSLKIVRFGSCNEQGEVVWGEEEE